jgi:hypothetical protein
LVAALFDRVLEIFVYLEVIEERSVSDTDQRSDLTGGAADAGSAADDIQVDHLAWPASFAWLWSSLAHSASLVD